MTTFLYRKKITGTDNTIFGGLICLSDFDTNSPRGNIAERIERDRRFDEQCRKNRLFAR